MATEWIDIVDTAVKIGLGAVISGFATYHVTRIKNDHENKRDKKVTHKELILEAAKSADEYFDYTYKYFSKLDGIATSAEEFEFDDEHMKEMSERIKGIESELTEARTSLYNAQSRLELLGLVESVKHLHDYRGGENELRSCYFSGNIPTKKFLAGWSSKYVPIKDQFRKSLSKDFLELI